MPTTAASPDSSAPAGNRTRPATRDRLLDAAESLLLARDIDDVSIRAINAAAGMNPAAVHYHFGSKDALIGALLERRLAPHWEDALTRLTERRRAGDPPAVTQLVDVVLKPLGALTRTEPGRLQLRLLARVVLARRDVAFASGWFGLRPWIALLCAAVPGLDATEAGRRLLLAFDLILHSLSVTGPAEAPGPHAFRSLRAFTVAGLSASPPR